MDDAKTPETLPVPATEVVQISYQDRLKSILENSAFSDEIFSHVANGGDLISLCSMKDIRYSDFAQWCWRTPAIGMMLAKAFEAQREWVRMRVLNELRNIALVDLREAFTESGELKDPKEWPESLARSIASVDTDELFGFDEDTGKRKRVGETKKIKMHGKIEALKLIGQELGLFVQKSQVEVKTSLEELVGGSWETEIKPAEVISDERHKSENVVEVGGGTGRESQGSEKISAQLGRDDAEPSGESARSVSAS